MRKLLLSSILLSFSVTTAWATDLTRHTTPAISSPIPSKVEASILRLTQTDGCSGNACGLCTDTDCCGGASLGWKLCQSDCSTDSSGTQQYKCCMVSECP